MADDLRETRPRGREDHGSVARATRCPDDGMHARGGRFLGFTRTENNENCGQASSEKQRSKAITNWALRSRRWKAWIVSKEHPASLPPEGKGVRPAPSSPTHAGRSPATRCARAQAPRKRSCRQARALEQDGNTLGRPAKSWVILVRRPPCAKAANLHPNCPRGS